MLQRLAMGIGLALLGATALPAQAQLASSSTQFSGTAPQICQVGAPIQAETPMAVTNGGNGLMGETSAFSFVSNTPVGLQLRSVTIDSAPTGANGSYVAGLHDGASGGVLLTATNANASTVKDYAEPLTSTNTFKMRLNIEAPTGSTLTAGNYVSTVTVDCLSPNI